LTSSKAELLVTMAWNEMTCPPVMDEGHSLQIWWVPPNILGKLVRVYHLSSNFSFVSFPVCHFLKLQTKRFKNWW